MQVTCAECSFLVQNSDNPSFIHRPLYMSFAWELSRRSSKSGLWTNNPLFTFTPACETLQYNAFCSIFSCTLVVAGPTGDTGTSGPKGDAGVDGSAGPKGSQGDTGSSGEKGFIGQPGNIGGRGFTGGTGQSGPKGTQGPVGPQGLQGSPGLLCDKS